ncbi:MAG TPA: retropepsin-like aspartic protease [Planctomycetaceae bacterium]|nr:retropepsin-like aspartic protease [Planctomycetaceae bacterium]
MALPDSMTSIPSLTSLCIALVVVASVLIPARSSAWPRNDTATVLAKIREAMGHHATAAHPSGVLVKGFADTQGLQGSFSLLFDAGGRFIQKVNLRRQQIAAFDGRTGWAVDWSGTPHVLELADLEIEQTAIWVRTGRWLAEDGPFRVELQDNPSDAAQFRLHLQLKQGIREMDLWVDRSTWLPTRLTARSLGTDETWEFGDYHSALGLVLAHRAVHRFGGSTDTYEIRTVRPAPTITQDPYKPVLDPPRDTEFRSSVPARFEVKQAAGGHLFVRPKINGQEVGWFAFDTGTGAGMTISSSVADRLGMPAFGKIVQGGAGKLGIGKLHEGKTFELGSITIHNSVYVELPQAFCDAMKKLFGLDLVGTCGYDLFSRAVVDLDLKELTASCHDPNSYTLANGNWQELLLNRKVPCVHVTYEGSRDGIFQFDTGAGTNVLFHAPAVEKLKLLENRKTTPIKVGGVGGTLDAGLGQLEWFQVGGRRLEKLTAIFLARHEGALDDPYVAGTFGAGILKNMKIVFDYPHRRIAFGK